MKKKKIVFFLIMLIILIFSGTVIFSNAETLTENIEGQLGNLDIGEIEDFLNSLNDDEKIFIETNFLSEIQKILNGEMTLDYGNIFGNLLSLVFSSVKVFLPSFLTAFALSIFCGLICSNKSAFLSESVRDIVFYVCFASVILLVVSDTALLIESSYLTIKKLSKLVEIMLPIILTLMVASGGSASVAIYKPAVAFLSNGIIEIYLLALFPIITFMLILSVICNLSKSVKLSKLHDFVGGVAKWILGLSISIFTFFITIEGLTSANIDGISLRATKYAISNSIPLIGNFLSGGFDLVLAGTVLIKNAVGVGIIFIVFSVIFIPIINIISYQLMLKLFSALIEPVSDERFSGFFTSLSKCCNYILAIILAVGFMFFIIVLLLICSANAFI